MSDRKEKPTALLVVSLRFEAGCYAGVAGDIDPRDEFANDLSDAADRLEKLQALVDRLPKTADGMPWVEGDLVFCPLGHPCDHSHDGMPDCEVCEHGGFEKMGIGKTYLIGKCYSTREAALAAKQVSA